MSPDCLGSIPPLTMALVALVMVWLGYRSERREARLMARLRG